MKCARLILALPALLACGVESTDRSTGGVDLTGDERCPAGVVAVLSDYLSTQVALLSREGTLASDSFLSSGSTEASGLAAPLSGDVVVPSNRPPTDEVVLLDRFGTNVVTWANKGSAAVRAQLPIGTGFEANPYDYLELADGRAYVARFGENTDPGQEPFDRGGDLLIVDTRAPSILGSIDLGRESGALPPRPSAISSLGSTAIVVLARLSLDFQEQGDGELVGVDTTSDVVAWQLTLTGLKGCGRAAVSPSGDRLAVACTGKIDIDGNLENPEQSAVVLLDSSELPPTELARYTVHEELGFSPQSEVQFASETLLLGKTQTPIDAAANNVLFSLDLESSAVRVLREAAPSQDGLGLGIAFGGIYCDVTCSSVCLLADASAGVIRRFDVENDLAELAPVKVGSSSGLPPVVLGPF